MIVIVIMIMMLMIIIIIAYQLGYALRLLGRVNRTPSR
jgi:hypothetical protein